MEKSLLDRFYMHVGQTSSEPVAIQVERAEGAYFFDQNGRPYLDLIAGISVCNLGHGNPLIKKAVKDQVDRYMHLMVYGELVQTPQVELADLLCQHLPDPLDSVFFVNSGSEAVEGALKLKRLPVGRDYHFENSYHGATHGAMSVMSNRNIKVHLNHYSETRSIRMGIAEDLEYITKKLLQLLWISAGRRESDHYMRFIGKCYVRNVMKQVHY